MVKRLMFSVKIGETARTLIGHARAAGVVAPEVTDDDLIDTAMAVVCLNAMLAGRLPDGEDAISASIMAEAIQYHRRAGVVLDGQWHEAAGWSPNFSKRARGVLTVRMYLAGRSDELADIDPWLVAVRRMAPGIEGQR